jgi:sulfatase modifying factor 1
MTLIRKGMLIGAVVLCLSVVLFGCEATTGASDAVLVIDSKPVQGADVAVNGEPSGQVTPATLTGLSPDPVLIEVSKEGFKKAWRNVTPVQGQQQHVVLELEAKQALLSVDSEPKGAQVMLDNGVVLGTTPLVRVPIQVGRRSYTLKLENYKPATKSFEAEEYFPYSFTHQLEPESARLEVTSRPSSALVFLNDQAQNKRTPTTFELTPGTYTVSVEASGYVTKDETVTLGPNEKRALLIEMEEGQVPPGMVLIPAGEFLMGYDNGAPDERPRRSVQVDAFYIDKYEVTNEEFKQVFKDHRFESGKEKAPASNVTWEQADSYARAVGKRLPTEEEWEKAARGTDGLEYPWGNEFNAELCNSAEKPTLGTEEVGSYRAGASPYGCMDMAGNVYEWTSSWYNAYPGNTSIEKDYGQIFRVLRGGSYLSNKYDVRCASRHYDRMKGRDRGYGFRCAKSLSTVPGQ